MKVNYFDFGVAGGEELYWMVDHYFPQLGIVDYSAYGFEACFGYYNSVNKLFESFENVNIIHKAISNSHGETIKLHHAVNTVGHSIFSSKDGLNNQYEEVESVLFSKWVNENSIDLDGCLNILKVNIEGAEWYLFNDLVDSGLINNFSVFLGAGHDIEKVGELNEHVQEYYDLLDANGIEILRYSEWKPERNVDIVSLIDSKLIEMEENENTF